MNKSPEKFRVGVDIGGTFTDVVVERGGSCLTSKVLTTPDVPVRGVLAGLRLALAELAPPDIGAVVHGTTLATNALIERRGATVGAIVTVGFRDILEIAYERRYDQYDLCIEKPDTLVPRERVATVAERVAAAGQVLEPLDPESVHRAVDTLVAGGVESLAVCLLHAYANPAHEKAVRDIVESRHPGLPVSLSCEVSPEVREFDRLSTAVADACIKPLMEGYLTDLARSLREGGFDCPLYLMTSGGGMTTLEAALGFPVRLVESGPSGGAILAAGVARSRGCAHALSFDNRRWWTRPWPTRRACTRWSRERPVALTAGTSHLYDLGGLGMGPNGSDVHDEGLFIPPVKLVDRGEVSDLLVRILKANSRSPESNEGDLYRGLVHVGHSGSKRRALPARRQRHRLRRRADPQRRHRRPASLRRPVRHRLAERGLGPAGRDHRAHRAGAGTAPRADP